MEYSTMTNKKTWIFAIFLTLLATAAYGAYPSDSSRTKNWSSAEVLTETDLENSYDEIHTWVNAAMDSSSGHKHDATTNEGPKLTTLGTISTASAFSSTASAPDVDISGDVSVGQQLDVTGASSFTGNSEFSGNVSIDGTLNVNTISAISGVVAEIEVTAATATATTSTTSTSYADMNSMSITFTPSHADNPILIFFDASGEQDSNTSNSSQYILNIGASTVATTERRLSASSATGGGSIESHMGIFHHTTLAASSQTVKVQYKATSGATFSVFERVLYVIEVKQN